MPHKHPKRTEKPVSYNIPSHIHEAGRAMAEYTRRMCEEDNSWTQPLELTWGDDSKTTKYTIHWDVDHEMSVSIKNKNDDEPYIPEFLSKPFTTSREEINLDEARVIDVLSSMPSSSTTVYDYDNKRNRQLNVNDEQAGVLPHMPHKIPVERKLSYLSSGDPTGITYLRQ